MAATTAVKRYSKVIVVITVFILIVLLTATFSFVSNYVDPAFKGFFCDDHSIRYPYVQQDTIPVWGLAIIVLLVPLLIVSYLNIMESCVKTVYTDYLG